MEQQTDSKLGKQYDKAVYHDPVNLTYMQSTSCEKYVGEAQGGIKIARKNIDNPRWQRLMMRLADDNTLLEESQEELERLLMKVKEESEKLT